VINLLPYDDFLYEYYNSFNSKTKDWNKIKIVTHNVATKKGYFDNIFKNMTPEDKEIIEWYRDGGYRQIADFLFANDLSDKATYPNNTIKSLKECILKLDNILEKTKIKKDVVLWKGLSSKSHLKESLINVIRELNINDTYTFQNFFSTSINFQYAVFSFAFQSSEPYYYLMKINTPAGTKGTYISHNINENEVLLQRNQTIKLKKIYEYNINKLLKRHILRSLVKIYEFDLI
jgi:hypothetical protein